MGLKRNLMISLGFRWKGKKMENKELWINNKLTKMTKEEAVLKLIDVHAFLCRYSNPHDKWTDAVNIGIEVIKRVEQEPTTKKDLAVDTISREQAKEAIRDKFKDLPSRVEINTILNELPSVTPQERKGHWIDINDDGFFYHRIYKCSHCGDTVCDYPENIQKYKYCHNCGAKMNEPQESEETNI